VTHAVMTEYESEPIPGLPGIPPAGEVIVWQGSPDWRVLARTAFHARAIAAYFSLLAAWALAAAVVSGITAPGALFGFAGTIAGGLLSVGLLHAIAWGSARTTIYTLTNRRIVMRIGIALPKCINLPLAMIGAADLAAQGNGAGDLALRLTGEQRLGYVALWPHARAWRLARPEPTLRALPKAAEVAELIARTCQAANPDVRRSAATGSDGAVPQLIPVAA
jgi:hypothetical protein